MTMVTFGKRIYRLESVSSTQDVLKEQFKQGAPEGSIAVALEQTLGRGRLNRSWDSPAGLGLWMSVLLVPTGPEENWPWVSFWGGIAVKKAIEMVLSENHNEIQDKILLKWPNDVMVKHNKLGGVLAEIVHDSKDRKAVVLGIGINLSQHIENFPPHLREQAISLFEVCGEHYLPDEVLEQLIFTFEHMVTILQPIDADKIEKIWLGAAWGLNKRFRVQSGEETFDGTFTGLGSHGEICLQDAGEKVITLTSADKIERLE